MKKKLSFFVVACVSTTLFAQSIVSTIASNKNVILEVYTGTNCTYCPDGHRIADQIMADNPGRAWVIRIHQGSFAGNNPDYKTDWGNALANQYGVYSYPDATINRGNSLVSRGAWANSSTQVLAEVSPVNVAARASINRETRELTVLVEAYYTSNAANPTNKLNVALIQNNVLGPQSGGTTYYPAMMVGDQYKHLYMLRHLLTEQWGVEIPATVSGTFYTETFSYTLPENIRNVPLCLEDLEIIAFVAEDNKTILSGCKAKPTFENEPAGLGKMNDNMNIAVAGYYNIMGLKLDKAPEKGLYIILYDNGKAEKIIKK